MNAHVILEAQQFSANHFHNPGLSQAEFSNLIGEQLHTYPSLEDRVVFLKEVIRLGNIFLTESGKVLQQMEMQNLSQAGIGMLSC